MNNELSKLFNVTDEKPTQPVKQDNFLKPNTPLQDFLMFKKMLAPLFIRVFFWLSILAFLIQGIIMISKGSQRHEELVFMGIATILLGPVVSRIFCELLIILFSINDTLTEVKNLMKAKLND